MREAIPVPRKCFRSASGFVCYALSLLMALKKQKKETKEGREGGKERGREGGSIKKERKEQRKNEKNKEEVVMCLTGRNIYMKFPKEYKSRTQLPFFILFDPYIFYFLLTNNYCLLTNICCLYPNIH